MSKLLLTVCALVIVLIATSVRAEIVCTVHGGCWETGKRIRLPGSVYRGVDTTITSRENPTVRQSTRGMSYVDDHPARSPADRR
jgi:hypothetical protein